MILSRSVEVSMSIRGTWKIAITLLTVIAPLILIVDIELRKKFGN